MSQPNPSAIASVLEFITQHWHETLRHTPEDLLEHPEQGPHDNDLLAMPYPYHITSRKDYLQEFYYWDSYFTNEGLIRLGRENEALFNVENILHMVDTHGFMPNGNRRLYLNRSQPPYLAKMISAIFQHNRNKAWLSKSLPYLEKEVQWWVDHRQNINGLAAWGHHADQETLLSAAQHERKKGLLPLDTTEQQRQAGAHFIAECECGLDFTSLYEHRCADHLPIDLNALLYGAEHHLSELYGCLGQSQKSQSYRDRAEQRRELIHTQLWDEQRGMFGFWDTKTQSFANMTCSTQFLALSEGLASREQAHRMVPALLETLEQEHGLTATSEPSRPLSLQWDHPNGWAPHQYIAIQGLRRYGFHQEATRLKEKYLQLVCQNFEREGDLFEKYNVITGGIDAANEYGLPTMMGWTSGMFVKLALEDCSK